MHHGTEHDGILWNQRNSASELLCSFKDDAALPSRPKLLHDRVTLLLRHVPVHGGHCEIHLAHLRRQPVHLKQNVQTHSKIQTRRPEYPIRSMVFI